MSIQLILYPQTFNGEINNLSHSTYEVLVNGLYFSNLSVADSWDSNVTITGSVVLDALTNQPPAILNTWYRFRSIYYGTPALPTDNSAGNLVLNSVTPLTSTGIYQRLSNLNVGQVYTVTVNIATSSLGILTIKIYSGNTLSADIQGAAASSTITGDFTCTSIQNTVLIDWLNETNSNLIISSISIVPSGQTPSGIPNNLGNGQVICDLYENEDIPLTLSVDDFKNVAEKVQSYSKAFNLPATKRNNQIFDSVFEVTRTDTGINFNPYKRTQCVLKEDGFILFEGYLRLIDIQDKKGDLSYNVNLYSEVIALADVLKDKTFADLDFTELNHDYNVTQVQNSGNDAGGGSGLTYLNASTSGFRDDYTTLRYPFIDWEHQYIDLGTEIVIPNLESTFRPCINIKYLIDRIFNQPGFPFTYTSDFFDTTDFNKLYMDFNWGDGHVPVVFDSSNELTNLYDYQIPATYTTILLDEYGGTMGGSTLSDNFGYDATTGVFTAQQDGQIYTIDYDMVFFRILSSDIFVRWIVNGQVVNQSTASWAPFNYVGSFTTPPLNAGETVYFEAYSTLARYDLLGLINLVNTALTPPVLQVTTSVAQFTSTTLLATLRGELGQWDFFKGLMTMFNLVSIPDKDNPNNVTFEPYGDVFINNTASGTVSDLTLASRSIAHDWTDKIDVSEMKLKPLTDLNKKTVFKFVEDDDDYAFSVYRNSVQGFLYGSKELDETFYTILDGKKEIVAEPFAATVIKPLMMHYPDLITPALYAMNDDGESESFENSPRIFYNNGETDTGIQCYVPAQNGSGAVYLTTFLQFSHLSDIPTSTTNPPTPGNSRDFHFGMCQLIQPIGSPTVNNLFQMYWSPYYNELYNPNTRTMTIKVKLNAVDIDTFNFYDTVMIKNREYRVNKIDYKPNDLATVEFILIP